jgi:hypothetical protein
MLLLEEYKTLREESLQALRQQQQTLQVGFAAMGVVAGLGIKLESDQTLSAIVLMAFVPLLAAFIVVMWLGELQQMSRAGAQVSRIEQRWRDEYGEWTATWETLLASKSPTVRRLFGTHHAVFATIVLGGALAAAAGAELLGRHQHWVGMAVGAAADLAMFAALTVAYWRVQSRLRELEPYERVEHLLHSAPSPPPETHISA